MFAIEHENLGVESGRDDLRVPSLVATKADVADANGMSAQVPIRRVAKLGKGGG